MHPRRALNMVYADLHDRAERAASASPEKEARQIRDKWYRFDADLRRTEREWQEWNRQEQRRRLNVAALYGEVA